MPQLLSAGDAAPHFLLPTVGGNSASGKTASLADFAGRQLVLFFYPADDTEVCTREALAFSEAAAVFSRRKVKVIGVSRDSLESHRKFIAKYDLKLRLASDVDGAACNAFGVWQEKQLYGRKFMGVVRSTFLVGPDGVIRQAWRNVRVPGHIEKVLEATAH